MKAPEDSGNEAPIKLYTIGHSNHSIEKFIQLLKMHAITTLVDVRTSPYSRYHLQFNKEALERACMDADIRYIFEGKHLGGRPTDRECYKEKKIPEPDEEDYLHKVDYPAVMKREWFQKAIERLLRIAEEQSTAILCSEEDPARCHRHHLIAKYLLENYPHVGVYHIRGDGSVYHAKQVRKSVEEPKAQQMNLL